MSTIKANNILNSAGTGAPAFPSGVNSNTYLDASGGNTATINGKLPIAAADVATNISAFQVGSVGSYAFLQLVGLTALEGATISGSSLKYAGINSGGVSIGGSPSGTWRLMGNLSGGTNQFSLFLRIA